VIALALLAARPFLERPAGLARDLVLIVDASASMAATDIVPNRLEAAKDAAIEALKDLPAGGKVSVIAAGRTARVVATGSTDIGRVRQAIESIEVTASSGDLGDALRLGGALAARSGDAEILIATDAALANVPTTRVSAPVKVLQVGREQKNQAIVALAIRTDPSGLTQSAFISVANLDIEDTDRRLEIFGDGAPLEVRDLTIPGQRRQDVVIDDITQGGTRQIGVIEVRLTAPQDGAEGPADQLAIDDRAWAVVPDARQREILVVGEGDPYLETALSYLPSTRLFGVKPSDWPAKAQRTDGTEWDLIIFESFVPPQMPRVPILAIAPPRTSPLGEVTGKLTAPGIGSLNPDEPILRYVDLSTTHVAEARRLELPDWARSVIPGPNNAPLLYAGERDGIRTAVMAFEPRRSDLPLQVAFPILLANLAGELMGGSAAPTEAVAPGSPVTLPIPVGSGGMRVTSPDGTTIDLPPGTAGSVAVTFSQTDQLGVYVATIIPGPDASPGPSGSPAPSATPRPSPSGSPAPSGSGAPGASPRPSAPPRDPNAPIRFAVDLFDVDESNIAPGQAGRLTALGGFVATPAPAASGQPGGSASPAGSPAAPSSSAAAAGGGAVDERPPARDELWVPILLLVILVLCVEWAVYQRDAVIRLWRSLNARLGRPPAGGA
jgi:Ca-activated chloride channel homolog